MNKKTKRTIFFVVVIGVVVAFWKPISEKLKAWADQLRAKVSPPTS